MSRPFRVVTITVVFASCVILSACKTPYTDMYSPRRNYFKPVKEKAKPTEVLEPTPTLPSGAPAQSPPPPSLPPIPNPADAPLPEEPPAVEPAPADDVAIPGL